MSWSLSSGVYLPGSCRPECLLGPCRPECTSWVPVVRSAPPGSLSSRVYLLGPCRPEYTSRVPVVRSAPPRCLSSGVHLPGSGTDLPPSTPYCGRSILRRQNNFRFCLSSCPSVSASVTYIPKKSEVDKVNMKRRTFQ